jgi:hypothetical protein
MRVPRKPCLPGLLCLRRFLRLTRLSHLLRLVRLLGRLRLLCVPEPPLIFSEGSATEADPFKHMNLGNQLSEGDTKLHPTRGSYFEVIFGFPHIAPSIAITPCHRVSSFPYVVGEYCVRKSTLEQGQQKQRLPPGGVIVKEVGLGIASEVGLRTGDTQ